MSGRLCRRLWRNDFSFDGLELGSVAIFEVDFEDFADAFDSAALEVGFDFGEAFVFDDAGFFDGYVEHSWGDALD